MNASYFRRLFDYNFWAHARVWNCVVPLSDEQFTRSSDYSIGSLHAQLVHVMGAEWLWLQRVTGLSPADLPSPDEYPTRAAIRARWDVIERDWRAYLEALTDERLPQPCVYVSITGRQRRETPLWEALAHTVNHSTDHRAQILALIHQLGGQTIEQDLIFYT